MYLMSVPAVAPQDIAPFIGKILVAGQVLIVIALTAPLLMVLSGMMGMLF
jgi:hypothetical protein